MLDGIGTRAVVLFAFLLILFGGFGDEERGGEVGGVRLGFIRI